jgi:hypothetical protein
MFLCDIGSRLLRNVGRDLWNHMAHRHIVQNRRIQSPTQGARISECAICRPCRSVDERGGGWCGRPRRQSQRGGKLNVRNGKIRIFAFNKIQIFKTNKRKSCICDCLKYLISVRGGFCGYSPRASNHPAASLPHWNKTWNVFIEYWEDCIVFIA